MSVAKYPNAKPISNRKTIRGNLLCLFFMPALYLVSLICQLAVEKLVSTWDTYRLAHNDLAQSVARSAHHRGAYAGNPDGTLAHAGKAFRKFCLFHCA